AIVGREARLLRSQLRAGVRPRQLGRSLSRRPTVVRRSPRRRAGAGTREELLLRRLARDGGHRPRHRALSSAPCPRHWRAGPGFGVSRRSRSAAAVTDLLSLTPAGARDALTAWLAAR